jgi:hypothetical protein
VGAMKIAAEGEEMFAFGAVQTNIRTVSEQPKYSQSLAWGLLKSALDIPATLELEDQL